MDTEDKKFILDEISSLLDGDCKIKISNDDGKITYLSIKKIGNDN